VLDDLGWIQQVVVNQQSGHLIDGHLRVSLALRNNEPTVPVLYVDLDEREEALALATLDPIAAMAVAAKDSLDALLREVDTGSAAVQAMLGKLAADTGVTKFDPSAEWEGMPEFEQEDALAFRSVKVNFLSQSDVDDFAALLGQTITQETKSLYYPKRERAKSTGQFIDES
jgi:ParB-like chromosome segregation protein Spo0J